MREQLEFTVTNEEREMRFVRPERLYDLGLEVDIPLAHFLVIGPSREAKWPSSLGRRF